MAVVSRWIAGGMYQCLEQNSGSVITEYSWGMYQCVEQNNGSVITEDCWRYVPMCGAEQWQCYHGR